MEIGDTTHGKCLKPMEIYEDDIFLIISSKCSYPQTPAYDWLRKMGGLVGPFPGLCFMGTVREVSINDAGKQELGLNILFH